MSLICLQFMYLICKKKTDIWTGFFYFFIIILLRFKKNEQFWNNAK